MPAMRTALAAAALSLLVAWTPAQPPRYEDFPATVTELRKSAKPRVQSGKARRFRTLLSREGTAPPNFAGHYLIVQWGCGTCCNDFAIIDSRTGEVFMSPFTVACKSPFDSKYGGGAGIDFEKNSRLLIITGARNEVGGGRYYYEWTGRELKLLLADEPH